MKRVVVFVRARDASVEPKEIDVTGIVGTTNYRRFLSGLSRKVNETRFLIDSEAADAEHERRIAEREVP